jgi:hypothetical protein
VRTKSPAVHAMRSAYKMRLAIWSWPARGRRIRCGVISGCTATAATSVNRLRQLECRAPLFYVTSVLTSST